LLYFLNHHFEFVVCDLLIHHKKISYKKRPI
jgi:hypothetical protein